jgi:hypothetical protein
MAEGLCWGRSSNGCDGDFVRRNSGFGCSRLLGL